MAGGSHTNGSQDPAAPTGRRRWRLPALAALALVVMGGAAVALMTGGHRARPVAAPSYSIGAAGEGLRGGAGLSTGPARPMRWFSPSSVWNSPLPRNAALDPRSRAWVSHLAAKVAQYGPWINTTRYSVPVYTVPPSQPRVPVAIDEAGVGYGDEFASVPVPPDLKPSPGTDASAVVWQPSTDTLWDFWSIGRADDGSWHARTAGRITAVSQSAGLFDAHPWAERYGATASEIPEVAGLITPAELKAGRIDHVVAVAIPHPLLRWWWTWPASRSDGDSMDPLDVPMGARFRLPATLDVSKLGLPPAGAIIARAVQQYGLVVRDSAAAVTLVAQDPVNLPANPYPALFGGLRPDQLLARFPWSKLQALRSLPNQAWPQPAPAAPGGVPIKGGVKRLRRAKASAIRSLG